MSALSIKEYNGPGLAKILEGAADMIQRAATLYAAFSTVGGPPPCVRVAMRKEAEICLAEAEELIAKVRAEGRP